MPHKFYRFRSTDALLGDFRELDNQEIYFTPPDELNDALEGFYKIVWQGDAILWRNLIRHYLLILLNSAYLSLAGNTDFGIHYMRRLVRMTDEDLPQEPIASIYRDLITDFFSNPVPTALIKGLAQRNAALRRDELINYLRMIHPLALDCVTRSFHHQGLQLTTAPVELKTALDLLPENLEAKFALHDKTQNAFAELIATLEIQHQQLDLLSDMQDTQLSERQSWIFLYRDFPAAYTRAIEQLLFPNWYTACFAKDPTNPSMWGVYADGHRGVCLEFTATPDATDQPTLILKGPVGWRGRRNQTDLVFDERPYRFAPVRYANDYPEMDFFRSLGTLPLFKLTSFWYSDGEGGVSPSMQDILRDDETWRQTYWARHFQITTTKLPQWEHEGEHRLVLSGMLIDRQSDPTLRKLRYRFADLSGVIFGINTSYINKVNITHILTSKAKNAGIQGPKFYQAVYSNSRGRVEIQPLSLLSQAPLTTSL